MHPAHAWHHVQGLTLFILFKLQCSLRRSVLNVACSPKYGQSRKMRLERGSNRAPCLMQDGIPKNRYDSLRKEILTTYGHQHLVTLQLLQSAGKPLPIFAHHNPQSSRRSCLQWVCKDTGTISLCVRIITSVFKRLLVNMDNCQIDEDFSQQDWVAQDYQATCQKILVSSC